ncbi:MAG: hypothetical protein ACHQHO_07440 [Solirubrobacterales bacterium]
MLWLTPNQHRAAMIAECVAGLTQTERELFQVAPFEQTIKAMAPRD